MGIKIKNALDGPLIQKCRKDGTVGAAVIPASSEASASASAVFDVTQQEKKVIVFLEIGENLRNVLVTAINSARGAEENIGEAMESMGVNLRDMVESAVKMEVKQA